MTHDVTHKAEKSFQHAGSWARAEYRTSSARPIPLLAIELVLATELVLAEDALAAGRRVGVGDVSVRVRPGPPASLRSPWALFA